MAVEGMVDFSKSPNDHQNITLPPISSFDNLIKAAEKQYMGERLTPVPSGIFTALGNRVKSREVINPIGTRNNSGILSYQFLSESPLGPSRMHSKIDLNMIHSDTTSEIDSISASKSTIRNSVFPIEAFNSEKRNSTGRVPLIKPTWCSLNDSEQSSTQSSRTTSAEISRSNSSIQLPSLSFNKKNVVMSNSDNSTEAMQGSALTPNSIEYSHKPILEAIDKMKALESLKEEPHPSIFLEEHTPPTLSVPSVKTDMKVTKKRRRKQCPICHGFFANLTTHKAIHLEPDIKPFVCSVCQRGFVRQNDVMRHEKMHWKDKILSSAVKSEDNKSGVTGSKLTIADKEHLKSLHCIKGTYECPYNSALIELDLELYPYKGKEVNFITTQCHKTGVFSRCDTFKNHLKALHFEYPQGTRRSERSFVSGKCKHCNMSFANVDEWINEHVGKNCGHTYH